MAILLPILVIQHNIECYPKRDIHGIGEERLTFIPIELPVLIDEKNEKLFPFKIKSNTEWRYPGCSSSTLVEYSLPIGDKHESGIIYLKNRDIIGIKQKGYEYYEAMILNDSNWSGQVEKVEDIL